jgi:ATP-dependent DNA helicase RecQ
MPTAETLQEARRLLQEHFGYDAFRLAQETLISGTLDGRDVLGIMPTGAGKSMCYQIPALLLPGITLVVSPLISLMQDQVRALKAAGIPGAYLNSALTYPQYRKALENARQGMYKIIYVAPERLGTEEFQQFAQSAPISLLAVDEAHCVSQWGHDFRPSYMQIAPFVEHLPKRPPVAAFTATATPAVRQDILQHLHLRDPEVQITGFDRENLTFRVLRPTDKAATLLEFVQQHPQESGIVYCSTRKLVERVTGILKDNGISAAAYHAGLPERERREAQNDFLFDRIQVMVATNAFGMGIDKQNVSYVVHYNMPKNMEAYYQEAGRAGRDGSKAECLLLYGPGDVHTAKFLIQSSNQGAEGDPAMLQARLQLEYDKLEQMRQYALTSGCLRSYILTYFGEKAPQRCGSCGNCLARDHIAAALRAKTVPVGQRQEKTLYDLLHSVRKDFAEQAGLPPELIFTDRTLQEMAQQKPQTEYEMLQIPGVSPVKYQKYGKTFLKVVQRNKARRSGVQ